MKQCEHGNKKSGCFYCGQDIGRTKAFQEVLNMIDGIATRYNVKDNRVVVLSIVRNKIKEKMKND